MAAPPHLFNYPSKGRDLGKSGFPQTWKPMKEHMVQRLSTPTGCLDKNAQALLQLFLADIVVKPVWT